VALVAFTPVPAGATGSPPSASLSERIEQDVGGVLGRHGLTDAESGARPWFTLHTALDLVGFGGVFYLLELHRVGEVPLAARMEIIEYCMRLHAEGGVSYLRLQMREGPRVASLFPPRPAFEMVIGSLY
jgi:hypothetical protein